MPINSKENLYKELLYFVKNSISLSDYFVCIYGSHATGHFKANSDLDIFFATKSYNKQDFDSIRDFILSLHHKYNLKIDEEVPYTNKLLIKYSDIQDAIDLKPFIKSPNRFSVPEVKYSPEFLNSKHVRLRLVLNALTSPNLFIYGNKAKYKSLKKECENAIIRLACGLLKNSRAKNSEILSILRTGLRGEVGQAHLGYKTDREEVMNYLVRLIKRARQNQVD